MKIHYVTFSLVPSDKANSIQSIRMCQAFSRLGISLRCYCRAGNGGGHDVYDYYGVENIFTIVAISVPTIRVLNRLIFAVRVLIALRSEGDAAVVYARDKFTAGILTFLGPRNLRVILEVHAPPNSTFWRWWIGRLVRSPRFLYLVSISGALATEYHRLFKDLAAESVVVAHDGAEEGSALQAPQDSSRDHRLKVGYVGSLRTGKGIELISQLAPALPEVDFCVVGGDQQTIDYWMGKVSCANLKFYGFVKPAEAERFVSEFDILIAPYQPEVLVGDNNLNISPWMSPLKIFEYMSRGKPIVASRLPVLEEVLCHEVNAMLAEPTSVDDWKSVIVKLSEDAGLRERIGRRARSDFLSNYTWHKRAEMVLKGIATQ